MKQVFWTSVFWIAVVAGFLGYIKWFDMTNLGPQLAAYVIEMPQAPEATNCELPALETTGTIISTGTLVESGEKIGIATGIISQVATSPSLSLEQKFDTIQAQLKDIAEKLDVQNSNTPDAVNISLKTTKKTNIRIFPLNGGVYTKYTLAASDDILRDTLNLLFDKSAFTITDTRLDTEGNLTLELARVPGSSFGGSAMVEQVKTAIEKTALQFPQIKKVIIIPDTILQP